jgi:asparagine synthase (glutamine-hydrolysing)
MCGIVGLFHYGNSARIQPSQLVAMRDTLAHRGPDDAGSWISEDRKIGLAHRRLSIVDLSAAAAQPMSNEDDTVWVTFNGEIYNHLDLRRELMRAGHRFRTDHSDTEVLVHGYEEWGIEGLTARLSGEYAIGLWDVRNQVLSLIRDRLGVKPLYFSLQKGTLLFASEIKAILAHPSAARNVDPTAMYHYLTFLATPAPMTMFEGVFKLPAGYFTQIKKNGQFTSNRYWDVLPGNGVAEGHVRNLSDKACEQFYIDGIRSRLNDAVRERMMSDVPVGVFLSGGTDSSTIVALMSRLVSRPIDTFTIGFSDHPHLNEFEYARVIAKKFNTNHHEMLIDERDMIGYLDTLIHSQDEPVADWTCIPMYFVAKLAKEKGVGVIQVGEGSDEEFSGYTQYLAYVKRYRRFWKPFRALLPKSLQRGIADAARFVGRHKPNVEFYTDIVDRAARDREHFWSLAVAFWDSMKDQLVYEGMIRRNNGYEDLIRAGILPRGYLELDSFNVVASFVESFGRGQVHGDILNRLIYNEFKLRLPEILLMRVDKISMSVSLEARVPFLAHGLVEFAMDIPMKWKIHNDTPKYILKRAIEGLIPNDIIYRKKVGFDAPMKQWLHGSFGTEVRSKLLSSSLLDRGYFDRDYICRLFQDHRQGNRDNSMRIWTLFNLTSWYNHWIDNAAG